MNSSASRLAARYFPLSAAGFRSNPFRALSDAEWADSAVVGAEIEAAFRRSASHIQLLGGMGAGKTTTLLGLLRLAQDAGLRAAYEYFAEGQSQFTTDPATCDLLLLDEAQRLSRPELARLLDRCTDRAADGQPRPLRLAFASHDDLGEHFERRKLPLVSSSVDELPLASWRAILAARLAAAALRGQPHATLSDDAVQFLAQTFGADRRTAVAFLYEVFQQLRAPVIVDAALLRTTGSAAPGSGTA